jgi:hypothetical protein
VWFDLESLERLPRREEAVSSGSTVYRVTDNDLFSDNEAPDGPVADRINNTRIRTSNHMHPTTTPKHLTKRIQIVHHIQPKGSNAAAAATAAVVASSPVVSSPPASPRAIAAVAAAATAAAAAAAATPATDTAIGTGTKARPGHDQHPFVVVNEP